MSDDRLPLLRPANRHDAAFLGRLWAEAFPGERTATERTSALLDDTDPYGGLADVRVADEGGRPVGAVRPYRLRLHLHGRIYPTLGLGAVAVIPERRHRGLGRRICREAMRIGRERGDAVSLLFPIRVDYYDRLGYALVGERHRYRFRTADLTSAEGAGRVVRLGDDEGWDRPAEVYGRVAPGCSGTIERERRHWRRLEGPARVRLLHRREDGRATGYLVASSDGAGCCRVLELVTEEREAAASLLGALAEDGPSCVEVEHDAFPSERMHRLLPHPVRAGARDGSGLWFEAAGLLRGPMLRILHPGRIVTGDAEVALEDPELPENRGRWRGGERRSEEAGAGALTPSEAAVRLAEGTLPGLPPPPEGWDPLAPAGEFRLFDQF